MWTLAVCGACATAVLALPRSANAGAYTVVQCDQALSPVTGQAVPEATSAGYALGADCATGNGLQVLHNFVGITQPGAYGRWVWRAPQGTVFTNLQATARLVSAMGEKADLAGVSPTGQVIVFGSEGNAWEPADQLAGEFIEFRSGLRCADPGGCPSGGTAHADVRDLRLTVDDRSAPQAVVSGPIFDALAVRGDQIAGMRFEDAGGGIRQWELRVNGSLVDGDILDCQVNQAFAVALQPCSGVASQVVSLHTSDAPFVTGKNKVTACASDLALDRLANTTCATEKAFVDDVCPESSIGGGSNLSASFAHGKLRTRVSSTRRPRIKGKLTTASGDGVAGASVCALTKAAFQHGRYEVADVSKTRASGRYSLSLPPGPSRTVYVHRVSGDEVLAGHRLVAKSSVRPSLELQPSSEKGPLANGQRLRFKGRLPGPSCGGRVVKVQAKVGRHRWQVFRAVRTNDHCSYTTRYKLRSTTRPTRYRFRVRVPHQSGYPYLAGVSPVRARAAG